MFQVSLIAIFAAALNVMTSIIFIFFFFFYFDKSFSLFGFFFMGPTIYCWMRLASVMWPRTDIKSSICKAVTEQWAYDPMAISTFLFTMSLMEGKSYEEAKREVKT